MSIKKYYVILQEEEVDLKLSPAEQMVYLSIKSFCANGKRTFGLSSRNITSRTSLSQPYVLKIVKTLLVKGLISIIGSEGHLGGAIAVYKVITPQISEVINTGITKLAESDNQGKESDNSSGSKNDKVKKENEEPFSITNKASITPKTIDWTPLEYASKNFDKLQSADQLKRKN